MTQQHGTWALAQGHEARRLIHVAAVMKGLGPRGVQVICEICRRLQSQSCAGHCVRPCDCHHGRMVNRTTIEEGGE